jgi:CubicO group peptidase (beta-lactamase class C family)
MECSILAAVPEVAAERDVAEALLSGWLPQHVDRLGVVGMAAGLVLPGGDTVMAAHGLADRDGGIPMTTDTPLRLASVTKMFTLTALLIARDEGLLSLDAPVTDLVPELSVVSPAPAPAPITLRQCVSHTAGLPTNIPPGVQYWDRLEPEIVFPTAQEAREWLRDLRLVAAPMTTFHYSNVGFLIAGLALEAAFGQPYEEIMQRRVLEPLGMGDAFFGSSSRWDRLAQGYRLAGGSVLPAPKMDVGWDTAGGGLCCSGAELMRFLELHLADLPAGGAQILGGSSVREAREPVFMTDGEHGVGLGWWLGQTGTHKTVMHSGGIAGYDACVVLVPSLGIGGFLLSNTNRFQSTPLLLGLIKSFVGTVETRIQLDALYRRGQPPGDADGVIGQYGNTELAYDVIAANGRLALVVAGQLDKASWLEPTDEPGRFYGADGFAEGELVEFRELRDGRFTELAMQGLLLRRV